VATGGFWPGELRLGTVFYFDLMGLVLGADYISICFAGLDSVDLSG